MRERAREPTSAVQPTLRGRDTSPPAPPQELPREASPAREFDADGARWIAQLAGKGACGTGSYGLALLEAVHFCAAAEPSKPLREALLARGRFDALYDAELVALLARAVPIVGAAGP